MAENEIHVKKKKISDCCLTQTNTKDDLVKTTVLEP